MTESIKRAAEALAGSTALSAINNFVVPLALACIVWLASTVTVLDREVAVIREARVQGRADYDRRLADVGDEIGKLRDQAAKDREQVSNLRADVAGLKSDSQQMIRGLERLERFMERFQPASNGGR
jgi:hypothetical protein